MLEQAVAAHMAEAAAAVRMRDGVIVYTNQCWDSMFGYPHGQLVGRHISTVNAATDRSPADLADEIRTALDRAGRWRGMVHHVRKNGSEFWCEASVTELDDAEHGRLWITVQRDVSKRIAEAERRDALTGQLRAVFDASPTATALITHALLVRDVNRAFCELVGRDWREVVGESIIQAEAALGMPLGADALIRAVDSGRPLFAEGMPFPGPAGRTIHVDIRARVLDAEVSAERLIVATFTPSGTERSSSRRSRESRDAVPTEESG